MMGWNGRGICGDTGVVVESRGGLRVWEWVVHIQKDQKVFVVIGGFSCTIFIIFLQGLRGGYVKIGEMLVDWSH